MRTDSSPTGRLREQLSGGGVYRASLRAAGRRLAIRPFDVVGHRRGQVLGDLLHPGQQCVAIAGDVKASEVMPVLEAYFGRLPKGPKPPPLVTVEPNKTPSAW